MAFFSTEECEAQLGARGLLLDGGRHVRDCGNMWKPHLPVLALPFHVVRVEQGLRQSWLAAELGVEGIPAGLSAVKTVIRAEAPLQISESVAILEAWRPSVHPLRSQAFASFNYCRQAGSTRNRPLLACSTAFPINSRPAFSEGQLWVEGLEQEQPEM